MESASTADVALVSMPWNIEQYTSLQIASLKAYLVKQGIAATSRHYHKDLVDFLGVDEREHVHEYGYGEHLFGALYYPERRHEFVVEITSRLSTPKVEPILDKLAVFCDAVVADLLAVNPRLVGFTTTHVQTMSSIYIARRLKEERPEIKIVLGGLALFKDFSERLLELFHGRPAYACHHFCLRHRVIRNAFARASGRSFHSMLVTRTKWHNSNRVSITLLWWQLSTSGGRCITRISRLMLTGATGSSILSTRLERLPVAPR
jgi:hypothetical protein